MTTPYWMLECVRDGQAHWLCVTGAPHCYAWTTDPLKGLGFGSRAEVDAFREEHAICCNDGWLPNASATEHMNMDPPPRPPHVSFGDAVAALKAGHRVSRVGWNGKGMYLALVARGEYGLNKRGVDCDGFLGESGPITLAPWIGMRTADAQFVPWLPSQTDILAEDWMVLP